MKKVLILGLSLVLTFSLMMPVLAQGMYQYGNDNSGNNENPEDGEEVDDDSLSESDQPAQNQVQAQNQNQQQAQVQASNQGETNQLRANIATRAKNIEELRNMISENRQKLQDEIKNLGNENIQKVWRNQNQVREAVHALLASEDLMGGIGSQVSAIAQQFNNSLQKTVQAEERIQARSKLKLFFFGGDNLAAEELKNEVVQNQDKIGQLMMFKESCQCSEEVRQILEEQIENMQQEQDRLMQLAKEQQNKKGIFGWLVGWLKK